MYVWLKDLGIGVKHAVLSINGKHTWEGTVEKGCGNQVFDYSTAIKIHDPIQPVPTTKSPPKPKQNIAPQSGNPGAMSDTMKAVYDEIDRELFPGGTPTPGRLKTGDDSTSSSRHTNVDFDDGAIRGTSQSSDASDTDDILDSVMRSQTRVLRHPEDDGEGEDSKGMSLEPERCKTRILRTSTDGLPIPAVDDSIEIYTPKRSYEFSEGRL